MVRLLRVVNVLVLVCLFMYIVFILCHSSLKDDIVGDLQSDTKYHLKEFNYRGKHMMRKTDNISLRKPVPVYIVEEHHEVIPYWFQAAKKGLIPMKGNILIHIDGHPDSVKPEDPELLSQYPRSEGDIRYLTSYNDAFIGGAIVSGLLSRVIWISPSWNVDFTGNTREIISFGWTFDTKEKICFCRSHSELMDKPECFVDKLTEKMRKIPVSACHLKLSYLKEDIVDSDAAKQSNDWISPEDKIIIDIDEDYYGCEAAIQPLLDVNISVTFIDDQLAPAIGKLFCASDSKSERFFDKIFYNLIVRLVALDEDRHNARIIHDTIESLTDNRFISDLCDEEQLESRVLDLVEAIILLTKTQMIAVADLGICLSSSSKQYTFDRMNGMRLCEGYNRPGSKYVNFYTPTEEEINERTKELKQILSKFPTPGLVTVCRSSRDGYVPAKYREVIEGDVIETLSGVFTDINTKSLVYDEELHGGKDGWYNRHVKKLKEN